MSKPVLICLALICAHSSVAQTDGTIKGSVIDENGQPIAHAKVFIDDMQPYVTKVLKTSQADDSGDFTITHVAWGRYAIDAMKVQSGYADTSFGFYGNGAAHTVSLSPQSPFANVTISLGPKAGRITQISVSDAVTGQPVASASVKLSRVQLNASKEPVYGYAIAMSTIFKPPLLVPARTPVEIKISAPGYADWYYPGVKDRSGEVPLVLKPDEERQFDILMQPLANR